MTIDFFCINDNTKLKKNNNNNTLQKNPAIQYALWTHDLFLVLPVVLKKKLNAYTITWLLDAPN